MVCGVKRAQLEEEGEEREEQGGRKTGREKGEEGDDRRGEGLGKEQEKDHGKEQGKGHGKEQGKEEKMVSNTIKGGYRRAEKGRKVLMMMKVAKLGWPGPGAG